MSEPESLWDSVTDIFDTSSPEGEVDLRAADNVLIAWPPILSLLEKLAAGRQERPLRILDFGCGTGGFCRKLHDRGWEVVGVDLSPSMIAVAESHGPPEIRYLVDATSFLAKLGTFDVVASIMVLQFIEDLDAHVTALQACLSSGSVVIFAVHNPNYVTLCLEHGFKFKGFDSSDAPERGFIDFDRGCLIPLFNRSSEVYDRAFLSKGFEKILEVYPPFTEEFIANYAGSQQREVLAEPKYLILGFRQTT